MPEATRIKAAQHYGNTTYTPEKRLRRGPGPGVVPWTRPLTGRAPAAHLRWSNAIWVSRAFLPLEFASVVSACALASDTPPSVGVLDVRLVSFGLTEQQLATTLCVTNPNTNAITFRGVTIALDVSGSPLAVGASDLPVSLPPLSSTVVPFTVLTTVQNIGPPLLGILRSSVLDYRVHGAVSLQGAFGFSIPFSRSGRLAPLAGGLDLASDALDPTPSRCSPVATTQSAT